MYVTWAQIERDEKSIQNCVLEKLNDTRYCQGLKLRLENVIKTDPEEITYKCVGSIAVAQVNNQWPDVIKTLVNLRLRESGGIVFNLLRQNHTFQEIPCNMQLGSLYVAIYVLTKLWAGRSGVRTPTGPELFPFSKLSDRLYGPPNLLVGGKAVGTWSLPSSTDVKNDWSCTSTPIYAFMIWTGITFFFCNMGLDM
jgi:hypothetical protein